MIWSDDCPCQRGTRTLSDIERDVCDVPDKFPVSIEMAAVEPLCFPVVVQTRPQVDCDPDLPLPVDKGQESLVEDSLDVAISGRESTVKISDVSRDICVVPDQFPVPDMVALTRSQAGCAPVFTWPVNDDMISQVGVGPDLLPGRVMKMVEPDVESGDQVLLEVVPNVDRDGCPTGN